MTKLGGFSLAASDHLTEEVTKVAYDQRIVKDIRKGHGQWSVKLSYLQSNIIVLPFMLVTPQVAQAHYLGLQTQ